MHFIYEWQHANMTTINEWQHAINQSWDEGVKAKYTKFIFWSFYVQNVTSAI